jgi:hypothetical protein
MRSSGQLSPTQIVTAAIVAMLANAAWQEGASAQPCTPHWDVGIGQPGIPPGVAALETYGGQLFAARAVCCQQGGVFVWAGAQWQAVGGPFNDRVWALQACDLGQGSALYAGGHFTVAGGIQANRIAEWNGSTWSPVDGGTNGPIFALLCVTLGSVPSLVVGGNFTLAGGAPATNIACWDGAAWSSLGTGPSIGEIRALAVLDDGSAPQLYASGPNGMAKWNGAAWSPVDTNGAVFALHSTGSLLYAGGSFISIGGIPANGIARWDGTTWMPLGTGVAGFNAQVSAIATYDDGTGDGVFIGGIFTSAGGMTAPHIAKWDGQSWSPVGSGSNGQVGALHLFPTQGGASEHLVVGGWFTSAGGSPASSLAAWIGCCDEAGGFGGQSFQGGTFDDSQFVPPDTMGAVGPDHFVVFVNGRYAAYLKLGGIQIAASSLDQFWEDAGVAVSGDFSFDPRILYDHETGRWFAISVDNDHQPNSFLLAVSATSDPIDGWTGFKIDSDSDDQQWADFPTVGLDADGLYVAANMFGISGAPFRVNLLVLPKADLLLPEPSVQNATLLENLSQVGSSLQPVVDFDDEAGFAVTILAEWNTAAGVLARSTLVGSVDNPTLVFGNFVDVGPHGAPLDADQPPIPLQKQDIDTGDLRLSSNVILRNGLLWAVQTVGGVGGTAAVRFLKVDPDTDAVIQDTIIDDPNLAFYYPSVAVNEFDQVVIGFSGSSSTQPVSCYAVAGETSGGVTDFGDPILLREGLDDYERLDNVGRNRWGDYSATTLDPIDSNHFWTVQEFVLADDVWALQVSKLAFCPGGPPCPWDLDGDGMVGVTDFLDLLANWGPCIYLPPDCPWDFDADGVCGVTDFLALLAHWGPCL